MADIDNRDEIVAECRLIIDANTPATVPQLSGIVFKILNHYDSFDRRSEQSKAALMADWLESLASYPMDILDLAARKWRESEKSAFMPTIGQIVSLCDQAGYRRALAERARSALEVING